ncbi:MAG: terminase family protein [Firmicutes bacterium]|nr:terminase family protein [Bacillota bacterium]
MPKFTKKQNEYIRNANARWNLKTGAVRSGKSYVDMFHMIPMRIRERARKEGLIFIMGVTESTIERNLLDPMRKVFGDSLIGRIGKNNKCRLFGETVYCIGAEKISQISKIQGNSTKYLYCDELAKWNKEVFNFLKTRLDKPYSLCDATCNPEGRKHWLKKFIDSKKDGIDLYVQTYRIEDNAENLGADFIENLKKELFGTIAYDKLIEGRWIQSSGLCFPLFANDNKRYINDLDSYLTESQQQLARVYCGIDYGFGEGKTCMVLTAVTKNYKTLIALEEKSIEKEINPAQLENIYCDFIEKAFKKYHLPIYAFADTSDQILTKGLSNESKVRRLQAVTISVTKVEIVDRIAIINKLLATDRFKIMNNCKELIGGLNDASYDEEKSIDKDVRSKDGSYNDHIVDGFEYSFSHIINQLENASLHRNKNLKSFVI